MNKETSPKELASEVIRSYAKCASLVRVLYMFVARGVDAETIRNTTRFIEPRISKMEERYAKFFYEVVNNSVSIEVKKIGAKLQLLCVDVQIAFLDLQIANEAEKLDSETYKYIMDARDRLVDAEQMLKDVEKTYRYAADSFARRRRFGGVRRISRGIRPFAIEFHANPTNRWIAKP